MIRALFVLAVLLPFLAACGPDDAEPPSRAGHWQHVRLQGLENASGVAVLEESLLLCAAGDRPAVGTVSVDALKPGATVTARALSLTVDRDAVLGGGGAFAAQGYRLGDLWDQAVELQGIAVQEPNFVYLADHNHRVVYVGRLRMGAARFLQGVQIERVFVVPGGDRAGRSTADWRDKGGGLAGLASVVGERRTEDLYAVDRAGAMPDTFRIQKLDRYGLSLGWFQVHVRTGSGVDVGGILKERGRYLVVRGGGRGVVEPVVDGQMGASVWAGQGVPGPDVEGAGAWQGIARGGDGVLYLVSGGPKPVLAWRPPSR